MILRFALLTYCRIDKFNGRPERSHGKYTEMCEMKLGNDNDTWSIR